METGVVSHRVLTIYGLPERPVADLSHPDSNLCGPLFGRRRGFKSSYFAKGQDRIRITALLPHLVSQLRIFTMATTKTITIKTYVSNPFLHFFSPTHRFCLHSDGTLNAEPVTVVVLFEPKGAYSTFDPIVWQCVLFSALLDHLI